MNEVAHTVRAYAEVKRQHNPAVKQSRDVWSENVVAHVTDLQKTMHGQYRQHGNAANNEKIFPVKDTADEGESKEKRKSELEVLTLLGVRLPKVQKKPQVRDGKD